MIKSLFFSPIISLIILLSCNSEKQKDESRLEEIVELSYYPSASGVEVLGDRVYIIGDDARSLLTMNKSLQFVDTMILYAWNGSRLPKENKPDNESISLVNENGKNLLYMFGSGSLAPYRNMVQIVEAGTLNNKADFMDTLYHRLREAGISDLNIEGSTHTKHGFILAARGHNGYPKNHLVLLEDRFLGKLSQTTFRVLEVVKKDSSGFSGISGLSYDEKKDRLLLSVSTEDTRSTYLDGPIGKSYIWIINDLSAKIKSGSVGPDVIIDLEKTDARFKGHKVESVAVMDETDTGYHLLLVADNDNGTSTLFRYLLDKRVYKF